MNKRKWIFMIIALVMIASTVLAGCGDNKNEENNAANEPSNTPDGSENNANNTPSNEPIPRGNITFSLFDRGNVPPEEGTMDNNQWTKWINENGPNDVEFELIPRWESEAKFNVLFASGSAPDYIQEYGTGYRNQLYSQKQLMPLDDLIEEHSVEYKAMLEQYPALRKLNTLPDGKMYSVGRINGLKPNWIVYVRADWLDNLGLEIPKTMEDFYEVARAFAKDDPDNNGEDDTYGFALSFVSGWMVDMMYGASGYFINDEDKLVVDYERNKAANEFRKRLFEEGIVDKDYIVDANGEKAEADWNTGKLGIYGNGLSKKYLENLQKNVPEAEVIAIEFPVSPFGQYSPTVVSPIQVTGMVNAKAEDPAAVIRQIDFMVREDTVWTLFKGIEGEHSTKDENGCLQFIDDEKKDQLAYTGDMRMLSSDVLRGDCNLPLVNLDMSVPLDQAYGDLVTQAYDAYLSIDRPQPMFTPSDYAPSMPEDIFLIKGNIDTFNNDTWVRAVVGGDSYTIDEAFEDIQSNWEKAGGQQVDDWYNEWYQENKDTYFFTDDLYDFRFDK